MTPIEKKKRKFTEKQLALLERYHYLHFKLNHSSISDKEDIEKDRLLKQITKFIEIW